MNIPMKTQKIKRLAGDMIEAHFVKQYEPGRNLYFDRKGTFYIVDDTLNEVDMDLVQLVYGIKPFHHA